MKPPSKQRYPRFAVLGLVICMIAGCIVPSQQTVRDPGPGLEAPQRDESGNSQAGQGLIKPMIPADTPPAPELPPMEPGPVEPPPEATLQPPPAEQASQNKPGPPPAKGQEPSKPLPRLSKPIVGPLSKGPDAASGPREWEDQKVKQMALELAAKSPDIKKIRICYAVKDNEWWIILYEDSGAFYELKQYIWDKDQDKLEQFLVLKKVPKSRFEEHIRQSEPHRACEMLDLPETNR